MTMTTRRAVLAAAAGAPAVPAAAQSRAAPEPGLQFVFEITAELAPAIRPGPTPYGRRNLIPITGGSFEGPQIRGKVLPGGGDWQLVRADGVVNVVADYFIQADDGAVIQVHNAGVISGIGGAPAAVYFRTSPRFEAPIGPHDWLNKSVFVSTVSPVGSPPTAVRIRVYKVT